jgi:membrane protease YdiL (CAAX protease family)
MTDILTYGLMLFCYSLYFIAVTRGAKNGGAQLKDVLAGKSEPATLFSRLIAGIFVLGIGATVLFDQRELDTAIISFGWNADYVVWTLTLTAMITGVSLAFKKSNPNGSIHSLPLHLPLSFVLIRTLFLIVYEFFFRGVTLFIMIEDFGVVIAIIFNLILYALVHWSDRQERNGSLIMGSALCGVTIYYHSVWPAIIIHVSLALSYEITLLIKNKSLIKRSWS